MDEMTRLLAGGTAISWAHYTFNPWRGCVKISPACRFCYAERETARWGGDFWGKNAPRPIASTSTWRNPRKWNKAALAAGERRRVFSGSLCDVFEDRPDLADARNRLFDLIETTESLIWMLLTKRPENIVKLAARYASGWPSNVWLGCSTENQRFAGERIPHLAQHDVPVRFISAEPLLGHVDLAQIPEADRINWIITGGESGTKPGIRLSHPGWYRALRNYAQVNGVPFHHKQNGMWVGYSQLAEMPERLVGHDWAVHPARHRMLAFDGRTMPVDQLTGAEDPADQWVHMLRMAKKHESGRLLDDQLWDEFPEEAGLVHA